MSAPWDCPCLDCWQSLFEDSLSPRERESYEQHLDPCAACRRRPAQALAGSATARLRFTREAQAAAAVSHDHVVVVHGVHEIGCLPYLVMEYIAGESLQDRLDRTGPLELAEIVRIGLQTASGLAAAHA